MWELFIIYFCFEKGRRVGNRDGRKIGSKEWIRKVVLEGKEKKRKKKIVLSIKLFCVIDVNLNCSN